MDLVNLIRNEELIYFVGSHPLFSLAGIRHSLNRYELSDPKITPYPGLRVEFPEQGVKLPLVNKFDGTMELTDPKSGNVCFVVERLGYTNGAVFRLEQSGKKIGELEIERVPFLRGYSAYLKDCTQEIVIRIKPIDKFIRFGFVKLHRLELGERLFSNDNKKIAEIMNLSYWSDNVTCRFGNPQNVDNDFLLLSFGIALAILAGYNFPHYHLLRVF